MAKIGLFLDKDQPGYSESFINTHLECLDAIVINVFNYLPRNSGNINKYQIFSFSVWKKKLNRYYKVIRLKSFLRNQNIKIVLAEYGHVGATAYRICQQMNLPLVVHFHGYDAYRYDIIERYGEQYKEMFAYAQVVIAVSTSMKRKLIELGCPEEKICINIYGVNEVFFKTTPKPQNKTFLSIGRFTSKKAPYLTVLAFNMVLAIHPDSKLIMIGTGELMYFCRKIVKGLQIEHAVDFQGVVDHDKVFTFLEQCTAFVQHSMVAESGDSEGTPVSILEAGAAGVPVVSTRHAGIPDVVIDGETGFLVDENDVFGMRDYMIYVIENPEEALEMGMKAKLHIQKNYTLEKSIDTIKNLLSKSQNINIT